MKAFQHRNPVPIGIVSLVVLALLAVAGYNVDDLPIIGGGTTYEAYFSESAGLSAGDPVFIAGIEAGRVESVELAGDRVLVSFRISDAWVGDQTTASIEIRSLLGAKNLGLDPRGAQPLDPHTPIPLQRTTAPYDVVEAFEGLTGTVNEIDTAALERSLQTLAETFRDTPQEVSGALEGLSKLSRTIATRDEEIERLLANTENVSRVLAGRNAEFEQLLADGNRLLAELQRRRDAIATLLDSTQALSEQLRGLVAENREQLRPALEQLDRVATILQRNQENLDRALELEAQFLRLFNNAVGTGRWFDNFVCGLIPPPTQAGPLTINSGGCFATR